jgi:hypothetical protein
VLRTLVGGGATACISAVGKPVIRHVPLALAALEHTSIAGSDPQPRIEAEAWTAGSWIQVLRTLVDEQPAGAPTGPIR